MRSEYVEGDGVTLRDMPNRLPPKGSNAGTERVLQPATKLGGRRFWAGLALAAGAAGFAGYLSLNHMLGIRLPGCGAGSPCAQAAASAWGRVPGVDWPVSFVGLAYFLGIALAWVASGGGISRAFRGLLALGAAASLMFLGAVVVERLWCLYCVGAHVCNLALVVVAWRPDGGLERRRAWAMPAFLLTFLLSTLALGVAESHEREAAVSRAEHLLAESSKKMAASAASESIPTPEAEAQAPASTRAEGVTGTTIAAAANPGPSTTGFSGRHRAGPETAQVRIVMYTDYQCPDCKKIEEQLKAIMGRGLSLAVIIKQFPLSTQCNPNAPGDLHANACWASRAAITAGMLRGDEGFWTMHHWLFARGGGFTDAELRAGLAELGFDADVFVATMQSATTLAPITSDIDEGISLGIVQTPMIFINGIELKGWNAPGALTRAVDAVLAASPAAARVSEDRPPTAQERYIADWREAPVRAMPESVLKKKALGDEGAPVRVVLFGDYQEPFCADADGILRLWTTGTGTTIRYTFAHFPVDPACNPATTMRLHDQACLAANAAEAALLMGGDEAFWKMHDWLMRNRGRVTLETLDVACDELGLEKSLFFDAMKQPQNMERVAEDARGAQGLGITSIPMIFINGKHVARWKVGSENLLPRIIDEAGKAGG
jgi:protein-disulfide isomerase/uncharacterized membrane protein